jgi:hypothetical protein
MDCAGAWPLAFLEASLSKKFMSTKYREHRENALLEREKQLLPNTQPLVEAEILKAEKKKELQLLYDERHTLDRRIWKAREELTRMVGPRPPVATQDPQRSPAAHLRRPILPGVLEPRVSLRALRRRHLPALPRS